MIFLKIFICSLVTVIIIAAVAWFALLVIDGIDGINKKLIIIINLLRKDYPENVPEVNNDEKDNEKDGSVG